MKLLNGNEIAGFIKERQLKQVRSLRQAEGVIPKLVIVQCKPDPVIDTYIRLKKHYGSDILIEVETHMVSEQQAGVLIASLNSDESVHGVIVQLPLADSSLTDQLLASVHVSKDVDGLAPSSMFEPATPMAIMWLLAGYNVNLAGKSILLIGQGKLVGQPLKKILEDSGHKVDVADRNTQDLKAKTLAADIIISATGSPAILYPDMIAKNAIIVDAGVASEGGKTVGDVSLEVYEREDITITPVKGGVGPLTVCALFDNVIRAARNTIS